MSYISIFKFALPYVTEMVNTALPIFTKGSDKQISLPLAEQHIIELQNAVSKNAESNKTMASQLEKSFALLDQNAAVLQGDLKKIVRNAHVTQALAGFAAAASILALVLVFVRH